MDESYQSVSKFSPDSFDLMFRCCGISFSDTLRHPDKLGLYNALVQVDGFS